MLSLRIRSEGVDSSGQHFGVNHKDGSRQKDNKMPYSSRRRKRKSRDNEEVASNDKMMLTFEYVMERPQSKQTAASISSTFTVLHKIAVTDAHGITLSTSTHRKTRSEIIAPPKLWMRLLDPLKTQEVALTIDDTLKVVTATSFHPGSNMEDNTVLARSNAVLKTETSTGVEEFDEYDYRSNRRRVELEFEGDDGMPEEVNERVILVFSIREAKVCVHDIMILYHVGLMVALIISNHIYHHHVIFRQCFNSARLQTQHTTMMEMHCQSYRFTGVDGP